MSKLEKSKIFLSSITRTEDPKKVGIYVWSLKGFKEFQKLCEPHSASAVLSHWMQEAIFSAKPRRGKK